MLHMFFSNHMSENYQQKPTADLTPYRFRVDQQEFGITIFQACQVHQHDRQTFLD